MPRKSTSRAELNRSCGLPESMCSRAAWSRGYCASETPRIARDTPPSEGARSLPVECSATVAVTYSMRRSTALVLELTERFDDDKVSAEGLLHSTAPTAHNIRGIEGILSHDEHRTSRTLCRQQSAQVKTGVLTRDACPSGTEVRVTFADESSESALLLRQAH